MPHGIIRTSILAAMLLTVVAAGMPSGIALGGAVYLKDGQVLHGKVKREKELITDSATGLVIPIDKATNCFLLDDGVRYVVFGPKQVENVDDGINLRQGNIAFVWPKPSPPRLKLPAQGTVGKATPFDAKGERTVSMQVPGNPAIRVKQKITMMGPYGIRVESYDYDWVVNHLTAEFAPEVILPLLRAHPDLANNPKDIEQQLKVFRFCIQAGWTTDANQELQELRRQFPNEQSKLDAAQSQYRQYMIQKTWSDIEQAAKVGRHQEVEELISKLPLSELPGPLQVDAANMRAKYEGLKQKLELARRMIGFCTLESKAAESFAQAIPVISRDLNYDTVDRAEVFATLAKQAEQAIRDGKQPKHSREDLLAGLITGWVFGPTAAETSVTRAAAAWELRSSLLAYQRMANAVDRKRLLGEMEAKLSFSLPEVAQAISLLPPSDAGESKLARDGTSIARQTKLPWAKHGPFQYHLILPPEYHPNRPYPLLVVLPNCGESAAQALVPWEAQAARNGYVLVAVDWGTAKAKYEYSEAEHAAVLDSIRDVKQVVQVDTDRVFLTGFGEGGNMAFDVGLSHPDQFAGVLPINGRTRWYASRWYWRNAQNLPFYVICGEFTNDIRQWNAHLFSEYWVEKGYPCLLVMYRGRIYEYYQGEIPHAFDWMERKRRAPGFPELGRNALIGSNGEEYQTFRETDNWFYWVSTDQVDPKHLLEDFTKKSPTDRSSAAVQATIRDNNTIQVYTRGLKQISLWLGRVKDPAAGMREMIDFTKPIKVTINSSVWNNQNQLVTPKLETLLEDFHSRCDRNRLFMARLEFNIK